MSRPDMLEEGQNEKRHCWCCWVASVVSHSVRPHRRQPTRLPRPWDSPGKNTGVGCHFLLQCMKVKNESQVPQLCPSLCDPTGGSPPGSSVHGIFQARALEWGASVKSLDLFLGFMRFSGNLGEKCSGGRGLSSNHILLSNGTSSLPLFQNV